MQIVETAILSSERSIAEALNRIEMSRKTFVLTQKSENEINLVKKSQLLGISKSGGRGFKLQDIPENWTESVHLVSQSQADEFQIGQAHRQLTGNPLGLINSLNKRLAVVTVKNASYLISGSEEFLVDYFCEKYQHPFYPPPSWYDGMICWCKEAKIIRESYGG